MKELFFLLRHHYAEVKVVRVIRISIDLLKFFSLSSFTTIDFIRKCSLYCILIWKFQLRFKSKCNKLYAEIFCVLPCNHCDSYNVKAKFKLMIKFIFMILFSTLNALEHNNDYVIVFVVLKTQNVEQHKCVSNILSTHQPHVYSICIRNCVNIVFRSKFTILQYCSIYYTIRQCDANVLCYELMFKMVKCLALVLSTSDKLTWRSEYYVIFPSTNLLATNNFSKCLLYEYGVHCTRYI